MEIHMKAVVGRESMKIRIKERMEKSEEWLLKSESETGG